MMFSYIFGAATHPEMKVRIITTIYWSYDRKKFRNRNKQPKSV
jgi:hypothetical protein